LAHARVGGEIVAAPRDCRPIKEFEDHLHKDEE
jgi:hypothetical protein